ncbi:MAG: hypothetical protein ACYCUG_08775, partial [Acidimicrobiales bacterium]
RPNTYQTAGIRRGTTTKFHKGRDILGTPPRRLCNSNPRVWLPPGPAPACRGLCNGDGEPARAVTEWTC